MKAGFCSIVDEMKFLSVDHLLDDEEGWVDAASGSAPAGAAVL